ncbi:MAG: ribonuclease HI [Spirochaetaceae bacterium]|jgi:ribonuclease HI|nr:ribonuclease HI [Spirochaetaceae bacterium]
MDLNIWTDGGCSGNPGPGGWAFVIADAQNNIIAEGKGGEPKTTNNRMELRAVLSALLFLESGNLCAEKITVHTDSQYVQKGISDWIKKWKLNGWRTSGKQAVKNDDLWKQLDKLAQTKPVFWQWVKGHSGIPLNERCDELTQIAINEVAHNTN